MFGFVTVAALGRNPKLPVYPLLKRMKLVIQWNFGDGHLDLALEVFEANLV